MRHAIALGATTLALSFAGCQGSIGATHGDAGTHSADGDSGAPADDGASTLPPSVPGAPRMLPAEAYLRSYVRLFGARDPLDLLRLASGAGSGFAALGNNQSWSTYLGALALPSLPNDQPRATQSNSLMQADLEKLGEALCTYAVLTELGGSTPLAQRRIFAFDPTAAAPADMPSFATRFDVLHRTFLGYPAQLAPADRVGNYYALYTHVVAGHAADPPGARLTADQAGWSAVCSGLVRHPEFQTY